jgi:hypothetical protein
MPGLKIPSPFPAPILFIITFLIYLLRKMKTPIMTTSDIGNGNIIEIVMLIPKDIPIQISWLIRNCLLSILVFISPQLFQCIIYYLCMITRIFNCYSILVECTIKTSTLVECTIKSINN